MNKKLCCVILTDFCKVIVAFAFSLISNAFSIYSFCALLALNLTMSSLFTEVIMSLSFLLRGFSLP